MGPIYNRIHLGLEISPELPAQNDSVANSLFSGPFFDPKKVPGPKCWPWIQKSDPGLKLRVKRLPPGMKKQKMWAEKPCRIQSLEFQTEPYSASYGQKTFWRVPAKILKYIGGKSCPQKRKSCIQKGNSCIQKGKPCIQKGKSCIQKGNIWAQIYFGIESAWPGLVIAWPGLVKAWRDHGLHMAWYGPRFHMGPGP